MTAGDLERSGTAPAVHVPWGFSVAELLAVLALSSLASAVAGAALHSLADHARVSRARAAVVHALQSARRDAYRTGDTVSVSVAPGAPAAETSSGLRIALPDGTRITSSRRGGLVRFFGDGLAEPATIVVTGSAVEKKTVVDSRGRVR